MKSVVSARGRVTVPKDLRARLGIRQGTELEFSIRNGALVAHKAEVDNVSKVYGCLLEPIDADQFIRMLRPDPEL